MAARKTRILLFSVFLLLAATLILMLASPSFAYFRALFDRQGFNTVMVELIFDHLDFDDPEIREMNFYSDVDENGNEIPWGSERNPYVISQRYHVQNLSVLQNAGFFQSRASKDGQAYFLVCTREGDPITIDCGGMTIAPVGTHAVPFTGVVSGAPVAGTAEYRENNTSVSTIANLRVVGRGDEADIGFFGKLGYSGTFDAETETVTGYAAGVHRLLLADVTVAHSMSVLDTLEEWWDRFVDHITRREKRAETHHVGIVAGHAEFASITDVSVYYSEDVVAFELLSDAEGSGTNYYSSTGLIGLLEYVNPKVENGMLDGSGAIHDGDVLGDGSTGGGGDESGSMTGYFLAKNLFEKHEEYLTASPLPTSEDGRYNVSEMKKKEGEEIIDLFKTVTMRERETAGFLGSEPWKYRNYFYFQDTVFTFAMSMSVEADEDGNPTGTLNEAESDYIHIIWRPEEDRTVDAVKELDGFYYGNDTTVNPRVSYRLQAITSLNELQEDGYYVLAFLKKNGDGTADDVLYLLDMVDPVNGDGTFVLPIALATLGGEDYDPGIRYFDEEDGAGIRELNLVGTNLWLYNYAFQYDQSNSVSIAHPFLSNYKLGVLSTSSALSQYSTPTTTLGTSNASSGDISGNTAFHYNWTFKPLTGETGRFSVSATYTLGRDLWIVNNTTYCGSKLAFSYDESTPRIAFQSIASGNQSERDTFMNDSTFGDEHFFTVFRVYSNKLDETGKIIEEEGDGNKTLMPKNILPSLEEDGTPDVLYSFDASRYVLQYVGSSAECAGEYKLAPLRSYKLNTGKGELLTEINHAATLYKTHNQNYQLTIGNLFGGGQLGSWINSMTAVNTGGVLNTTIGTQDPNDPDNEDNIYSIPTGMIAFEIREASESEPSYINLIAVVMPEKPCTIGVWAMNKESWKQEFSLETPNDSFDLPPSRIAGSMDDDKYIIKIVERHEEVEDADGRMSTVLVKEGEENETSYMYLGGKTVLVYYCFEVKSPGVYMIGSKAGPLSLAYFSVTGAAGEGEDGTSGSPLGSIDFVYAYRGQGQDKGEIITTDRTWGTETILSLEDHSEYYPSYLFVSMLPEKTKIQHEVIRIRRYIADADTVGTKRHFSVKGQRLATARSASPILADMQDDIDKNE